MWSNGTERVMSGCAGTGSSLRASSRRRAFAVDEGRNGSGPSSGSSVRVNAKIPLLLDKDACRPAAALSRLSACSASKLTDAAGVFPGAVAVMVYRFSSMALSASVACISLRGGLFSRFFSRA